METEVIKLLISSYFSLSKRTLIDMVPKGQCSTEEHQVYSLTLLSVSILRSQLSCSTLFSTPRTTCKRSCWASCTSRMSWVSAGRPRMTTSSS